MDFDFENKDVNVNNYNGLALAYIGDGVFELYIRRYVLAMGKTKVNNLHKEVIKYTSGNAQASFMHHFMDKELLTEDEMNAFKRGRNSHVKSKRKNMELKDYLDATGFEALIGYLYLINNISRLEELINICINLNRGENNGK